MQRAMPALLVFGVAACGGSSGNPTPPAFPASAMLAYVSAFAYGAQPSPGPTPLVLYDQQFLDPNEDAYLLQLDIAPVPASVPHVAWTSSNPSVVSLANANPFVITVGNGPPTAAPDETYVKGGSAYGTSTVTAQPGSAGIPPLSVLAYHFPSLSFGCTFRLEPAFSFDPDRQTLMQNSANWTSADLYDTYPSNELGGLDPCVNSPLATAPGTSEIVHVPYGGTLMPATSLQAFAAISATAWKDSGTTFRPTNPTVLVFKTEEGRIVKALLPIGPFEVSSSNDVFPY
jgi:hypothetical protein